MSTKRDLRDTVHFIEELGGVVVDVHQNKHLHLRVRFGCVERRLTMPTSTSDVNSRRARYSEIKRMAREAGAARP